MMHRPRGVLLVFAWLASAAIAGGAETADQLRRHLPAVDDPQLAAILADPATIYYTAAEMPAIYQDWQGGLRSLHLAARNISADPSEPFGNANREFPWGTPGGTHLSPSATSLKLLHLPERPGGGRWPVLWYRAHLGTPYLSAGQPDFCWLFPVGTVFGEVLFIEPAGGGDPLPFEVRTRTREADAWGIDIFRPFPTRDDLVAALVDAGQPALAIQVATGTARRETLDSHHPRHGFHSEASVQPLPEIPPDVADELVRNTPFRPAAGIQWAPDIDGPTAATDSIVPAGYTGAHMGSDRLGCARCHQDVQRHAVEIEPGRDWYGRVRGSDGIFSWHPFSARSASPNGTPRRPMLRKSLIDAGILAPYEPSRFPSDVYTPPPLGAAAQ